MRGSFFLGGVGWSGELSLRAKTQKSNHGLTLKWSLWDWRERAQFSFLYLLQGIHSPLWPPGAYGTQTYKQANIHV